MDRKTGFRKIPFLFTETFGLGRAVAFSTILLVLAVVAAGIFLFFFLAPPDTIVLTSGPKGSMYERTALKYARILKEEGVTLRILPSEGSVDNLRKLADPSAKIHVGFVQSGASKGVRTEHLVSLGSVSYEPLFVFYRSATGVERLSRLKGRRIAIGEAGSGTQRLARVLLEANGIEPGGPAQLLEMDSDEAAKAILVGTVDVVFLMGDSVSTKLIRRLLHTPGINLFHFDQADAYTRRIAYLNKVTLPKGAIDFGEDTPAHDVFLLAPTIELIAKEGLHPALSDLLLGAAQQVHAGPGLFRRKGEFPAPLEQEIRISNDALRFYKSGKGFFYRYLPFWLAGLVNRILVVLIPMILLLLPGMRIIPGLYKWHFRSRLFRWYRALMTIEQHLLSGMPPEKRQQLLEELAGIEGAVNRMKVPTPFADQFYVLRGHITFVRARLMSDDPPQRIPRPDDRNCRHSER